MAEQNKEGYVDVPGGKINYGSYQLAVLPDPAGDGPEGEAFSLAVALESDVPSRDTESLPAHLSLSDWTVPRRSEPVVYQQAVDDTMRTHSWQPQPLLARSGDRQYDMQDDADELAEENDLPLGYDAAADAASWQAALLTLDKALNQ